MNLNELLEAYHEDVVTLRRELIGYELLQRENDVYWKRETSPRQPAARAGLKTPR